MSDTLSFSLSCPVPAMGGELVELAHGGGGLLTQRLIDTVFRPAFAHSADDLTHDGAVLDVGGARLAFTTDSYVVQPLFFPGGDIGTLAVNGTVNDLAMCGARPIALSAGFVIEEGFALAELERIVQSMGQAAEAAGVRLVAGDTKAVVAREPIAPRSVRPGDVIVVSGDIGRHGMAVMAAREGLGFEPPLASDCAPLAEPVLRLLDEGVDVHCLRDLTRGGLATALIEIARTAGLAMRLEQSAIPVSEPVRGACEILGLDPLYVANEGCFVALVPPEAAERTLALLRSFHESAAIIGTVEPGGDRGNVTLQTLGSTYVLDLLTCEQLPRIC